MKLFHRRDEPPADVVTQLPEGERIVSWADLAGGGVVLASPSGLWWPTEGAPRLIRWQHITKATWQGRTMTVIEADVVDDLLLVERDPVWAELEVPRDLPPVVRKRVSLNVVDSQVHPVPWGAARFVARRVPGEDGLRWWARLEDGTPDTADVRDEVRARIDLLRSRPSEL